MAYVDLDYRGRDIGQGEKIRFDNLVPVKDWQHTGPIHSLLGFFIVSNPPGDWDTEGPIIKRKIMLFTPEALSTDLARKGGYQSFLWAWGQDLEPGDCIAVGTCPLPDLSWLEFHCAASEVMVDHFAVRRAS